MIASGRNVAGDFELGIKASCWVEKAMVGGIECSLTKNTPVYNSKYDGWCQL